jgi:hypothetical protein
VCIYERACYARMHAGVCMYVCVNVCNVYTCAIMYACMCVMYGIQVMYNMYMYMYMYICICIRIRICIYVYVCVCNVEMHLCKCTIVRIYIYMCVCICNVCNCICGYV